MNPKTLAIIIIPLIVLVGFTGGIFASAPVQQLLNVFVTNFPVNQNVTVTNFPQTQQNQVITLINRTFTVNANDTVTDTSTTDHPIDVSQYRNVRIACTTSFEASTGGAVGKFSSGVALVTWSMPGSETTDSIPLSLNPTEYFNITYPTLQSVVYPNDLQVTGPTGSSVTLRVTIVVFLQH